MTKFIALIPRTGISVQTLSYQSYSLVLQVILRFQQLKDLFEYHNAASNQNTSY